MQAPEKAQETFGLFLGIILLLLVGSYLVTQYLPYMLTLLITVGNLEADLLGLAPIHVVQLDFPSVATELDRVGTPFAWLFALMLLWLSWRHLRLSPRDHYRRRFTRTKLAHTLLHENAALAPILNWNQSLLKEDPDQGPWMVARQPIQFVAEHGLLRSCKDDSVLASALILNKEHLASASSPLRTKEIPAYLDAAKAKDCFAAQIGPTFHGFEQLPAYLKALAAVLLLFGQGQKLLAQKLLNQLSLSFHPHATPHQKELEYSLDCTLPLAQEELLTLLKNSALHKALRPHNRYTNLWFLALFSFARTQGILVTAEFLWLKPVNRPLFYLLNNYGRRTCWVEIAGAYAHYQAETVLAAKYPDFQGRDILAGDIFVQSAVRGLKEVLVQEGWIVQE